MLDFCTKYMSFFQPQIKAEPKFRKSTELLKKILKTVSWPYRSISILQYSFEFWRNSYLATQIIFN